MADGLVIDNNKNQISQLMGPPDLIDVSVSVSVSRRMARRVDETCMGKDKRGTRPVFEAA